MSSNHADDSYAKRADYVRWLVALVLVIGILYFGKPVIVPLAFAVLLTFIVAPLVMAVQRRGLGRVPAVLCVVSLGLVLVAGVGGGVGAELYKLALDLPALTLKAHQKIQHLGSSGNGPLSKLLDSVHKLVESSAEAEPVTPTTVVIKPPVLVARPAESHAFSELAAQAAVVVEPVATISLVLILVIFMLIKREDLRNRFIGLLGHSRLTGTTRVLVESTQRLSRYLLMQLCVNASIGLLFGAALLVIGVPYWFLWGFLTAVLRFVPYVGSWMAASFPVLLSFAISPGWSQPLLILGIFVVLDMTTANVVEPLLFGHSTGVSPVALLVAAVFWTWIWGPIGLVLSTPLTVCMVVLGQHVPRLRFFALLLGDQPALDPHVSYYQRLLAGDHAEAEQIASTYATTNGMERLADDVLLPALLLARRDRKNAGLTPEDETFVLETTQQAMQSVTRAGAAPGEEASATEEAQLPGGAKPRVLGCPAHHRSEELALLMVKAVAEPAGCQFETVTTRTLPVEIERMVASEHPSVLFIAILPPGGVMQARYLCRRLRKRFADLPIVVGYFGRVRDFDRLLVGLRSAGASYVTTSILQSRTQIQALLNQKPAAHIAPAVAGPKIVESSTLVTAPALA